MYKYDSWKPNIPDTYIYSDIYLRKSYRSKKVNVANQQVSISRYNCSSEDIQSTIKDDIVRRDTCKPFVIMYKSSLSATFTTALGSQLPD